MITTLPSRRPPRGGSIPLDPAITKPTNLLHALILQQVIPQSANHQSPHTAAPHRQPQGNLQHVPRYRPERTNNYSYLPIHPPSEEKTLRAGSQQWTRLRHCPRRIASHRIASRRVPAYARSRFKFGSAVLRCGARIIPPTISR